MSIPISSTKIRVLRGGNPSAVDPWEPVDPADPGLELVAEDVRAVISVGAGGLAGQTVGPGDSEAIRFTLLCDPVDIRYLDVVEDQVTGQRYRVEWTMASPGIGMMLASTRAGLSTYQGFGQPEEA